ncbi:hypothetical protein [Faecalibacter macacae]|uniref:Uncharacterized protein n=1 Tax=Faecalibacter macacae TaxID=1859289 RepID=A0A3L9M719_9FLAO|nr:hypothetical protein [Faecalibacter macacae]RLZ08612.1 hypothetical protein EAH69_09875 [Faecalibacter macacae]
MATEIKYGAPFPFGIDCTNPIYDIDPNKGPYESEADAMAVFPVALREVGRAIGIYTDATKKAVKVYNWEKNASDAWVLKPQAGEYELTYAKLIAALGYTPMATTHAANGVTTTLIGDWNTAFTNNHTHSNKTVLDATTASYTTADKAKLDSLVNYELTSAKVISALGYTPIANTHAANGVTTALITNWNTAFTNNHTHGNKSTLDTITAQRMLGWDAKMDKVTENGNIVRVLGLDAENNAKNAEVVDIIGIWDSNTAPTEQQLIESFPDALFVYAVAITPRVMYLKAGVEWKKVNLTDI